MKPLRKYVFNIRSPCVWLLALVFAVASGAATAGKGGNKPPKDEQATGVVVFSDYGASGGGYPQYDYGFRSDLFEDNPEGYDAYCHGIDGYVYLVTRFTHSTDSQNRHDRTLWVKPLCNEGLCFNHDGEFEVSFLGTHRKAELDGTPFEAGDRELVLRDMSTADKLWRATFNVKIGKKRWLLWGYQGFHDLAGACGPESETSSAPVWVRCEGDDSEGRCNDWTISTFDLKVTPSIDEGVLACMVEVEKGVPTLKHQDVEANFTIRLKHVPKGVACPPEDWP